MSSEQPKRIKLSPSPSVLPRKPQPILIPRQVQTGKANVNLEENAFKSRG